MGVSATQAKSIMFQLGMKNTGLAISLANAHFAAIAAAVTCRSRHGDPSNYRTNFSQSRGQKEGEKYESKYLLPNYTIGADAYEK